MPLLGPGGFMELIQPESCGFSSQNPGRMAVSSLPEKFSGFSHSQKSSQDSRGGDCVPSGTYARAGQEKIPMGTAHSWEELNHACPTPLLENLGAVSGSNLNNFYLFFKESQHFYCSFQVVDGYAHAY